MRISDGSSDVCSSDLPSSSWNRPITTNAWRASEVGQLVPSCSSPLVGEEGARAAQPRGKVRGNADGLTKRQLLPALTPFRARELPRHAPEAEKLLWRALREAFPTAKFRRPVPLGPSL